LKALIGHFRASSIVSAWLVVLATDQHDAIHWLEQLYRCATFLFAYLPVSGGDGAGIL